MYINMYSVFRQLCQGVMTVCQEGQTVLPPALNQMSLLQNIYNSEG